MGAPRLEDVLNAPDAPAPVQRREVEAPTLDAVLSAPDAVPASAAPPADLGPVRGRALAAADTVAGGKQLGALLSVLGVSNAQDYARAQGEGGLAGLAGGEDNSPALNPLEVYRAARDESAQLGATAGEQYPSGTALGIAAQVAPGLPALARGIPGLVAGVRAAPSAPLAALGGAVRGGARAAVPGALYGAAAGAAESPGDLTRGEFATVGSDAVDAALKGGAAGFALGAPFGGAAGAVAGKSAGTRQAAITATDLEQVAADRARVPEKVAAAKATAAAEERRPDRSRAIRMTGLDKVKMDPVERKAVAEALYDEPGPGGGSLAEELYAQEPRTRYASARKLRDDTGRELGRVRKEAQTAGGSRETKVVLERIDETFEGTRTEVEREALAAIKKRVEKASKDGTLDTDALSDLAEETGSLGFPSNSTAQGRNLALERGAYKRARSVLADELKSVVAEVTPSNVPAYEDALGRYGRYKKLEAGTRKLADSVDASEAGRERRLVKVAPEAVPVPEFPGGPDAERAAEGSLGGGGSLASRAAVLAARTAGGALGAKGGLAGIRAGSAVAGDLTRAYFNRVRPSGTVFRGNASRAQAALAKHGSLLEAALSRGPKAIAALQRFLIDSDPEYAAAFGGGSTAGGSD